MLCAFLRRVAPMAAWGIVLGNAQGLAISMGRQSSPPGGDSYWTVEVMNCGPNAVTTYSVLIIGIGVLA